MLEKPFAGWTKITFNEEFSFTASYLTDIPNDFVKALTVALEQNISTAVTIDGESNGECLILFNMDDKIVCAIVDTDNGKKVYEFVEISPLQFAQNFIEDIEQNYESWSYWMCEENYSFDLTPLKKIIKQISGGN